MTAQYAESLWTPSWPIIKLLRRTVNIESHFFKPFFYSLCTQSMHRQLPKIEFIMGHTCSRSSQAINELRVDHVFSMLLYHAFHSPRRIFAGLRSLNKRECRELETVKYLYEIFKRKLSTRMLKKWGHVKG